MDKNWDEFSLNDIKAIIDPKLKRKLLRLHEEFFRVKISPMVGHLNVKELNINDDTSLKEIYRIVQEFVNKKVRNK